MQAGVFEQKVGGLDAYDRAALVAKVAGPMGGTALKQKQYQRASYAETKLGGVIPAITEDVRVRLIQLQFV